MKNWSKYKPTIFEYKGKYIKNWFSNMGNSPINTDIIIYPTVEHFYQAMKSGNTLEHTLISKAQTPYEAKQMGKDIKNPFEYLLGDENVQHIFDKYIADIQGADKLSDIEKIKVTVMCVGLGMKFSIPEWKEKLLATGDEQIIEWNNWGDRFWGVDVSDCKGQNWLGKLLVRLREDM